jgi:hypothetical protein
MTEPTERVPTPAEPAGSSPPPPPPPRSRRRRRWLAAGAVIVAVAAILAAALYRSPPGGPAGTAEPALSGTAIAPATSSPSPTPEPSLLIPSPRPESDYLLMSRAALMALPTEGAAWEALKATADDRFGRPNLRDQDRRHGVFALAAALVYARTGDENYRLLARDAIMSAMGTERKDSHNAILSLGRQLGAYVLAADFIDLDGDDDATFRAWLSDIRTRNLEGHGRWQTLTRTHEDAPNNWGSFAGASRIAASLYLGDGRDVARAAIVLRGFLGERDLYSSFQPVEEAASWACRPEAYTPVNGPCIRGGIDLDGAIVRDIDRGGDRQWPPGRIGIGYTLESFQGLILQAELLTVNGYGDVWSWSDSALRRGAEFVSRSGRDGGPTWNNSEISQNVPWLLNARYGLGLPTRPAGQGRIFGYTDWLYGS